jgi:aquaporin related protein
VLPTARAIFLFPAQMLGAIVAAALVECMFPGDIRSVNTTLGAGTSIAQGVFIEMFLTSLLIITVLLLAVEKSKDTFVAPIGIGLSLFVAELAG